MTAGLNWETRCKLAYFTSNPYNFLTYNAELYINSQATSDNLRWHSELGQWRIINSFAFAIWDGIQDLDSGLSSISSIHSHSHSLAPWQFFKHEVT